MQLHHATARRIADHTGAPGEQARAHTGLGHAHHALGDQAGARHHYRRALTLYADLGMPDADQVRTRLAAVETEGRAG